MQTFILGSTSDVADSILHLLAKNGGEFHLCARNEALLEAQKSDIEIRYQVKCATYVFEADRSNSLPETVMSAAAKCDLVISAIGFLPDQDKAQSHQELTDLSNNVNFLTPISLLNHVSNAFEQRGTGTIVGISSVAGLRGRGSNYLYGSPKGAFDLYLSGLRNRLAKSGVHVMTVRPGFIKTKMTQHLDLPKLLTATPNEVARDIVNGVRKKKNVVYSKWFWRYIMLIIRLIPEAIFKKLSL